MRNRRMHDRRALVAVAILAGAAIAFSPADAAAQDDRPVFGLTASIGYGFLGGEDLDALDDGLGFEAIGSVAWPRGFELGVGAGISNHDVDPGDVGADLTVLFGEGRYRFGVPAASVPHMHPYVAARVGYANLDADGGLLDGDGVSGLLAGLGGGLEYWLSEGVAIDGGGTFNFLNLSDDVSGTKLDLRAGLKVRF